MISEGQDAAEKRLDLYCISILGTLMTVYVLYSMFQFVKVMSKAVDGDVRSENGSSLHDDESSSMGSDGQPEEADVAAEEDELLGGFEQVE